MAERGSGRLASGTLGGESGHVVQVAPGFATPQRPFPRSRLDLERHYTGSVGAIDPLTPGPLGDPLSALWKRKEKEGGEWTTVVGRLARGGATPVRLSTRRLRTNGRGETGHQKPGSGRSGLVLFATHAPGSGWKVAKVPGPLGG